MRRVEALADNPRDQLLAIFDALGEWFHEPDFKGCMFIKASSEYMDREDPIHSTSAEHCRLMRSYIKGIASRAGASDPDDLARQLMVINEGAIVSAHLLNPTDAAADARRTAKIVIDASLG
jgi:hypothetical protein